MNLQSVRYNLGLIISFEAAFLLLPCIVAIVYMEQSGWTFLMCAAFAAVIGRLLTMKKPTNNVFFAKEGFITVALGWVALSVIGAVPFYASGAIPSFVDSMFEIISGFTTTGASILIDVESLPNCMLFWRSFSHWVGGMGVLVFMLAILPAAGGQNMHLMRAESPGPSVGKLVPRLRKTASLLYIIYLAMTVVQIILLLAGGMPVFDSLCTAFGTAGTGGFGIKSDSIAGYNLYIQVVITIFMFLFGVNFNFYYLLLNKKFKDAFKMEEVRWYTGIFLASIILITINVAMKFGNPLTTLKDAAFSVSSVMTTTGFATADFNKWPEFSRTLLVILMFGGACAGSTGGGMKISRIILYVKEAKHEISHMVHPRSVFSVKLEKKSVGRETLHGANAFFIVYVLIVVVSILLVSIDGFDFTTTVTSVIATVNNIGPGLEMVGPAGNYADFSILSKIVMMFDMLAGRLEVFPLILLLMPATWRK